MSNLEDHEAEQAAITAMCEAWACDHPECQNELVTRLAPRWAWEIIYEVLSVRNSGAMLNDFHVAYDVHAAYHALLRAQEHPDQPFSRQQIDAWVAIQGEE